MIARTLRRALAVAVGLGGLAAGWVWASRSFWDATLRSTHQEPASARPFEVITRADHDPLKPASVLFVLHAYSTSPEVQMRGLALEQRAVRERDIILVVPRGKLDAAGQPFWNASAACCGEGSARPDDLRYVRGVLAEVRRHYAVDSRHVMAIGVSNGGFMAHRWACHPDSELTAIASISGAGQGPQDPPCTPRRPISVLQLHGDADDVVRYEGGQMRDDAAHPSARDSLEPFLRMAGLHAVRRVRTRWGLRLESMQRQEWRSAEARVALWTVEGGGHNLAGVRWEMPEILDFLQGK